MKRIFFKVFVIVTASVGLLSLTATVMAQANGGISASSNPNGPSVVTDVPFKLDGWVIDPVTVTYDPTAGPWLKQLTAPATGLGNYTLIEDLIVGTGPAWTDWHEEILTAGGSWVSGDIFDVSGNLIPGLVKQKTGQKFDFFFDPLAPGTQIKINKTLFWNPPVGTNPATIDVLQYPTTPEPASLALVAGALMGLIVFRRRRD